MHFEKQPRKVFCEKRVLKNFAKFTENHLRQTHFFERLRHRCFLVSFVKFFNNTIFTEHLRWLLLYFVDYPLINFFCALIFKMAEEICLRKSAISARCQIIFWSSIYQWQGNLEGQQSSGNPQKKTIFRNSVTRTNYIGK